MRSLRILIVCFMFTIPNLVCSQTDSLKCFTIEQVKVFLTTKVELNNCHEQSVLLQNDIDTLQEEKVALIEDNERKQKRLKRTRWVAGGGIAGTILFALITFIK